MNSPRKPLSPEQFNYMLDFAIRHLRNVYKKDNQRIPVSELRLSIQNTIKKLEKMRIKQEEQDITDEIQKLTIKAIEDAKF